MKHLGKKVTRVCAAVIFVGSLVSPVQADPSWWGFLSGSSNDNGPLNLGQLRKIVSEARDEFDDELSAFGGAGDDIEDLDDDFPSSDAYSPANIGQLKHTAATFWDRLNDLGYSGSPNLSGDYPWTTTTSDDSDYSPCLIGQAKYAFSMDVCYSNIGDIDGDSVTNQADDDIDGDGTKNDADNDIDGDGTSNSSDNDDDGDGTSDSQDDTPQAVPRPTRIMPSRSPMGYTVRARYV